VSLDVMNLTLVLAAALAGGWVARKAGYPSILGELTVGIVLGPPLLGLLEPDEAVLVIGKLGVVLLMLYIGIHLDPTALGKAAKPGALASLGGFAVPAALGFGLMLAVDGDVVAAAFVAVAMGVTSLATKSRILVDLDILNTRVAHVLMAGALFSDIAALVLFAALLGFAATGAVAIGGLVSIAVKAVVFLVAACVVGAWGFPRLGHRLATSRVDPSVLFLVVVISGLLFAAAADAAGLHGILGAFLAGLFIREGVLSHRQLAEVETRARNVSVGLLAPLFFVAAGFNVSFSVFADSFWLVVAVVVLATTGKILGTALFYLPTGFGFREGVAVGAGMNGRGAVEIIVAEIAFEAGIIDADVFSILVFMAVFTTATVPVLLTRTVAWLRRHDQLVTDERDGVLFVGAGPLARHIAGLLAGDATVALIDSNREHCRAAAHRGLDVVKGNSLDEDIMQRAGAAHARTLVAVTANAEVNLLAARLASRRFGIPNLYVAMPQEATQSMRAMVEDLGGQLLFGRSVDIASWDVDVDQGRVVDLTYTVSSLESADSVESIDKPSALNLSSLPLIIRKRRGSDMFDPNRDLETGDRVIALGRAEHPVSPHDVPSVAAD